MKNAPNGQSGKQNILTVVLEDYCHVGPVSRVISPKYWNRFESRVERNTQRTLDLLDETGAKATFFTLGWIAEHQPQVVAEVVRRGHEVASKGYFHRSIEQMTPEQFREDARRSKFALEDATGVRVRGYRVPQGGFRKQHLWALDVLAEEGFQYDTSLRPLGTGFSDEPFRRYIHRHTAANGSSLWEVPLSSYKFAGVSVPVSGGNFLRQLPTFFIEHAIDSWDKREAAPLVFYFHVWELDPDQPRISAVSRMDRIRQYRNLEKMEDRVRGYLQRHRFASVAQHFGFADEPAERVAPAAVPVSAAAPVRVQPQSAKSRLPISVVIPCFNEEATLGYLANTLDSFVETVADDYDVRFVFVDDGSKDGTWARMNSLFGDRSDCQLIQHPQNRGIAAATLTGIRNSPTEIVCAIDADGTFDPHQLKNMIPMLRQDVDAVTASCFCEQGAVMNVPGWRLALSKGASLLYRSILHNKLSHYTSCFRVYRRSAVCNLNLRNERYVGITEILSLLDLQGSKIVEYPAVLEVRLLGQSKMKILKTIWGHLQLMGYLAGERLQSAMSSRHASSGHRQTL